MGGGAGLGPAAAGREDASGRFGAIEIELDISATTTGVRSGKTSGGK
mgnify:CR=1 FL=1